MKPIKTIIKTKSERYPLIIGSKLISNLSKILKKNLITYNKCLLVIDKNLPNTSKNKIIKNLGQEKIFKYFFLANEKNKSQKSVNEIIEILLKKNFSRKDCLISVGGGITGDVTGFAASIFKRGIQFINIPTTLLSQVDSSLGGKTGINTKHGKNLVGSFFQPKLVISDTEFLKTLPKREIICGYGEILKHSLIMNRKFYNYLNRNISNILKLKSPFIEKAIFESCKIKKKVIERDEKEKGERMILNFGHTFAHAYEACLGFSKKLNHGEAVILGMASALRLSHKNNLINDKDYYSVINHIKENSELPFDIKNYFDQKDINKIIFFMKKDKKNYSNDINLILLKKIGNTKINNHYSEDKLKNFFKKELKFE